MSTITKIKIYMKYVHHQRRIEKAIKKMTKHRNDADRTKFYKWSSRVVDITSKRDSITLK